jgi:RHS repeat-associated protein
MKITAAKRAARVLTLVALLLGCALDAAAQSKTTQRGFQPGGSYTIGDIETINMTNGNMILRVPLGSLPAGRGGMSYGVNLLYNSKLYERADTRVPDGFGGFNAVTYLRQSEDGGWRYGVTYDLKLTVKDFGPNFPQCDDIEGYYRYRVEMRFPDGGSHEFRPEGFRDDYDDGWFAVSPGGQRPCQQPAITSTISYFSTDGTYTRLDVAYDTNPFDGVGSTWTLYFPDGRRVTGGGTVNQRIYDRNDNYVEIQNTTYNTHTAVKLVDQLDRKVILEYGSAANQDTVYTWGFNNEPMQTVITWKSITVDRGYAPDGPACCGIGAGPFGFSVVDQVLLPTQAGTPRLAYTFGYNASSSTSTVGWGEVSSVTLPSGAQTAYHWKWDNSDSNNPPRWEDVLKDSPTQKDLTYQQEYDGTSTPVTETWHYAINDFDSQITGPDGGVTREYWYPASSVSSEAWKEKLVYKTENPDGSVAERLWATNTPYIFYSGSYGPKYFNHFVKTEFTSIRNAAGALVKTAIRDYKYDKNGNVTEGKEYDWVDYGVVPRDAQGRPTGVPAGAPLKRVMTNTYYNPTPDSSDIVNDDPDEYHKATSSRVRNALESSEVGNGTQTLSRSEVFYDNPSTTANTTEQRSWDSYKGGVSRPLTRPLGFGGADNYVSTSQQYDANGNPILSTDANGNQTQITYGAVNGFTGLYPTLTEAAFGTTKKRTTSAEYDFNTGAVTRTTDVDNGVSTSTAYDVFGRPTLIKTAEGKPEEAQTVTAYSDVDRRVIVRSDLNTPGDGKLVAVEHYDQLGRVRLRRTLEDASTQSETDEATGIKLQTRYRYIGSNGYVLTSNPYRAATSAAASGEATMGWTVTTLDRGGRIIRSETFGGATPPSPWGVNSNTTGALTTSYDADATTVTDQAERTRKSVVDGLGRLAQVYEAPDSPGFNYLTSYAYDALDNLKQVTQGAQTRAFAYSSLSRLTSALNPEVCQQQQAQCTPVPNTYEYDANGNLKKRTDARGVTTTYAYDALNRITSRTHANEVETSTPDVTYTYDDPAVAYSKGRLTRVSSSVSAYNYTAYDALGRVRGSSQETGGVPYSMPDYRYNVAGGLVSEQYPSGRVVTTDYDAASRLSGVKDQATGLYYAGALPTDQANRIQYAPHGAASAVKLGNGLWEHTSFNSRLQLVQIGLGNAPANSTLLQLDYTYGTDDGHNDGDVRTQTITAPGMSVTQTYSYDAVNRLTLARETKVSDGAETWKQGYTYLDANNQNGQFGNRRIDADNTTQNVMPAYNPSISAANNRITSAGYTYDDAGNLLCDPLHPCAQSQFSAYYAYDADNRIRAANGGFDSGGTSYVYDGDGRRVKKTTANGEVTVFVYDATGKVVAEYGNIQPAGGRSYLTSDTLGSTRVVTDQTGQTVKARHDYLPFGEEISAGVGGRVTQGYGGADGVRQRYTSKERDNETGLDYFGARYFSAAQGRFVSVDPLSGTLGNPQTFNRYAYCVNNPVNRIDPDGAKAVSAQAKKFVFASIQQILKLAVNLNVSAGGLFALSAWETMWGQTGAYKNKNNPGGMSVKEVPLSYSSIDDGYAAFGNTIAKTYSDVLGIHDPRTFLDSIQDENGYKWNSVNKNYLNTVKNDILLAFGLNFFDDNVLSLIRDGRDVTFNGVTISNVDELNRLLNSTQPWDQQMLSRFISGVYQGWVDYVNNLGTENDPNVQNIRRAYALPGSNILVEEEAVYDYRVSMASR